MNTVKITVPKSKFMEIRQDLRRLEIRHYPFRRVEKGLEIKMYPNQAVVWILLKYSR